MRVTVSRVTRSYTFAGRTRDLWKLRSRLFRSTVNARFVVVLGSLVFLRRQTLHRLYISSLNVILVVKDLFTGKFVGVSSINSRTTAVIIIIDRRKEKVTFRCVNNISYPR